MTRAIEAENIGKLYRLGDDAKQHRIADMFMPWKRFPNPNEFWALKDISFNIEKGESVGIIGRNGAGKSTLLKILSRITAPTTGRVQVRGRVGTLLEVGTGFHPELSGRDNIFLSGTILGLRYAEVKKRLDEIIDFAGVEKFIDTPVKRYSSGMQVKLAFAVALYLEPEILIVDEVLAVGDLEFQRKSLNRLNEITGGEGRTVLFVSHSLDSIRKSCQRVIHLDEGVLKFDGPTDDGIASYQDSIPAQREIVKKSNLKDRMQRATGEVRFVLVDAFDAKGQRCWQFMDGDTAKFRVEYEVINPVPSLAIVFRLYFPKDDISRNDDQIITDIYEVISHVPLPSGYRGAIELELPDIQLRPNAFFIQLWFGPKDSDKICYDVIDANVDLQVLRIKSISKNPHDRYGLISLGHDFRVVPAEEIGPSDRGRHDASE